MSLTVVTAFIASNLYAIAQRGTDEVQPINSCCSMLFTLITTPSISYGNEVRSNDNCLVYSMTFWMELVVFDFSSVLNPNACNNFKLPN